MREVVIRRTHGADAASRHHSSDGSHESGQAVAQPALDAGESRQVVPADDDGVSHHPDNVSSSHVGRE